MNPKFVKAYVKSNKNDFNDAEAICEAAARPNMRFVPVKTVHQQDMLAWHRARELTVRTNTRLCNQIRSLLAERGVVTSRGKKSLLALIAELLSPEDERITAEFRSLLLELYEQLKELQKSKEAYDKKISSIAKDNEDCKRLMEIPGIGPICATALVASVNKGGDFKNGREMSAWLGLVPRQETTGGHPRLLGISKRGNRYLRKQLIHGARAVLTAKPVRPSKTRLWLATMEKRRPRNVVTVALANKNARIAWALLKTGEHYRATA